MQRRASIPVMICTMGSLTCNLHVQSPTKRFVRQTDHVCWNVNSAFSQLQWQTCTYNAACICKMHTGDKAHVHNKSVQIASRRRHAVGNYYTTYDLQGVIVIGDKFHRPRIRDYYNDGAQWWAYVNDRLQRLITRFVAFVTKATPLPVASTILSSLFADKLKLSLPVNLPVNHAILSNDLNRI